MSILRPLSNQRGDLTPGKVVSVIAIVLLLVYGALMVVPTYFKYEMLKYEVRSELGNAHYYKASEMRKHINEKIDNWSIDIPEDNITIDRGDYFVSIFIWYEVEKVFFGKWPYVFYFEIDYQDEVKSKDFE